MFETLLSALRGLPRTVASRHSAYSAHDIERIAGKHDCFVVVRGNPFSDCDGEAFIETVIASMQGNAFGNRVRFTARTPLNAHPDYRVVLLFNGTATVRAADLCGGSAALETAEPLGLRGRVSVLAAWCREDAVLNEVSGWIEGVKTAGDRRFARLVAQVTRDLFPADFDLRPGFKDT
jgi:hypothetical protein